MFALRTIDKDNRTETNINLGEVYTVVPRWADDPKEPQNKAFIEAYYETYGADALPPDNVIYSMLLSELQQGIPLRTGLDYYIVSGHGETYANLSRR